jgi:hypothetical protein
MDYFSSRLIALPTSSICFSSPLIILPALSVVFSSLFYYSFIESLNNNNNYKNTSDSESNSNIKKSNQGDRSTESNQGLYYKKRVRDLKEIISFLILYSCFASTNRAYKTSWKPRL